MANINGQGLMELADLISRREYNWGLVRSRIFEEELVRSYTDEHNIEYTSLADAIEALYKAGVINDASRENLHGIRVLGNKAAHEGDNDPQDAKNAYYMLKEELQKFSSKASYETERTPVRITRAGSEDTPAETEEITISRRPGRETGADDETGGVDMSYVNGRRSTRSGGSASGSSGRSSGQRKKKKKKSGIDLYTILKILIPVLILVLVIILLMSIIRGSKKKNEQESSQIETEMEATTETAETEPVTTEAPTTEAPTTEAPASYRISGEGVNIRYADNPGQIYTQLGKGTSIGVVEDFTENAEYADFAVFNYDGKRVIVSKKYIEKEE